MRHRAKAPEPGGDCGARHPRPPGGKRGRKGVGHVVITEKREIAARE
jgi:hypothetical protein